MTRHLAALAAGGVALAVAACSSSPAPRSTVSVRHPWARATAASQTTAAVYFTVVNSGDAGVTITDATVPDRIATGAMLHRITTKGSGAHAVVGMIEMGDVVVPAHEQVRFRPGASHVMLTGLRAPLRAGQRFEVVLRRADGSGVAATVTVRRT